MRPIKILHYIFAFGLGLLCAAMLFTSYPGPLMQALPSWAVPVLISTGFFAVLCFAGPLQFGLVVAYCLPTTLITVLLSVAKAADAHAPWLVVVRTAGEPIVQVWIGPIITWWISTKMQVRARSRP
jgi:hypothetical protein